VKKNLGCDKWSRFNKIPHFGGFFTENCKFPLDKKSLFVYFHVTSGIVFPLSVDRNGDRKTQFDLGTALKAELPDAMLVCARMPLSRQA
jgi:hypothetical protein